jgi:hypothetical protein
MASHKLPKRLFKNKEVVHAYQHERENKLNMKQMSRDHVDVLETIEFTLVKMAQKYPAIDDSIIDQALRFALAGRPPDEDAEDEVRDVYQALTIIRRARKDVPDGIWSSGLKNVRDSVRRHSSLTPGDRAYIRFVEPYLS